MRTAILTALFAVCSNAAFASQCLEKPMVEAFLKVEHGLKLHSWGLDDGGNMLELWLGAGGHWAIVTTRPNKCASVELPHQLRGRLWTPPSPNKAIPDDLRMNNGQGL